MTERNHMDVMRELSPENDWIVDLAIDYCERRLSPAKMTEFRDRLASDADFRAVAQPVIDAMAAPPSSREELERSWNDFTRRVGLTAPPSSTTTELAEYQARVKARSRGLWRKMAIAAGIFFVLMGIPFAATTYMEYAWFETLTTADNVEMNVRLPDGSQVHLFPGSELRYQKALDRAGRTVGLGSGEAEFTVASMPGRTFILDTPHSEIRVTGTRFLVRITPIETLLLVREGTVLVRWVDASGNAEGEPKAVHAGQGAEIGLQKRVGGYHRTFRIIPDSIHPPFATRGRP